VDSGERQGHPVRHGLLKSLDTLGIPAQDEVLVTLDAAHTCRETAREIKKRKQLYYVMNVDGNRPGPQAAVLAKRARLPWNDLTTSSSSARGRIRKWSCWITGQTASLSRRHPRSRSSTVTSSRYQGTPSTGKKRSPRTRHPAQPRHQPHATQRHEGHQGNHRMDRRRPNPSRQLHDYVERHPSPEVTAD
jgi:hypothetical protein